MKIKVHDIPGVGMTINKVVTPAELGLTEQDVICLSDLAVYAHIEKAEDVVIAGTEVAGKYRLECARCLEPIEMERTDQFQLYFDIDPTTEFINLGEDIRQELIVTISGVVLCGENCQGLCQGCGANLNREECRCQAPS